MMRAVYLLLVTACLLLALAARGTEARPQFFDAVGDFAENVGEGIGDFFEGVGDFFSGIFSSGRSTRTSLVSRPTPPLTFDEAVNNNNLQLVVDQ